MSSINFAWVEGCTLVSGARRCAIYDTNTGKLYSINESGKQLLQATLNGVPETDVPSIEFLGKLIELGIGELLPESQERIKEDPQQCTSHESPFLDFMWLELTNRCNLKCLHCYAEATSNPTPRPRLTLQDWRRIISEGAEMGCQSVQFTGGEPILYPRLIDLIDHAHDTGYTFIEVFSNGTLLTRDLAATLHDKGVNVAISLYGNNPRAHDRVTQVEGSFVRTLRAIEYLKNHDVPVRIATVAMSQNEDEVEKMEGFIENLGIPYSGFDLVRPSGRGKALNNQTAKPSLLGAKLMEQPIFWVCKDTLLRNKEFNSCWAGQITVTSCGDVLPCIMAREQIAGNIRQSHLGDLIQAEPLYSWWRLSKDKIQVCQDCEYRYACGDCRVLAFGVGDDFDSKSSRCSYNPYTGSWNNADPESRLDLSETLDKPKVICVTPETAFPLLPPQKSSSCSPQTCFPCPPNTCLPCFPHTCLPCSPKCQPCLPQTCFPCPPKCLPCLPQTCFPCPPNCMPRRPPHHFP